MTKYYSVNKQYAIGDGVGCVYDLVNTLVSASWTIQSASNGTSFNAGTTYWTPTSLAASNAWVSVREPTGPGGREWCFQRTTNDYTWRVKVSPTVGFTGSATATQVPTASDEGIVWGTGTDNSPTGNVLFYAAAPIKFHIVAESSPVGPVGNEAYGWWAFHNLAGATGNYVYGFLCQEPLAVGSYPALVGTRISTTSGEADPCIYGCLYDGNTGLQYAVTTYAHGYNPSNDNYLYNTFKYFYKYQNASGSLVMANDLMGTGLGADNGTQLFPRYVNAHPISGDDVNMPFIFGRYAFGTSAAYSYHFTNIGLKGTCNFLKTRATNRNSGITVNLATDAYIYVGDIVMPWPENITPEF